MIKFNNLLISLLALGFLTACGNDEPAVEENTGSHVWKSQTDNLQTAKDAAADLSGSLQMREKMSRPEN
jgi:outer membrane biogenesis lipoprotein LolB